MRKILGASRHLAATREDWRELSLWKYALEETHMEKQLVRGRSHSSVHFQVPSSI